MTRQALIDLVPAVIRTSISTWYVISMVWLRKTTPLIGEQIKCTREDDNLWDCYAMAVVNICITPCLNTVTKIHQKQFAVAK